MDLISVYPAKPEESISNPLSPFDPRIKGYASGDSPLWALPFTKYRLFAGNSRYF